MCTDSKKIRKINTEPRRPSVLMWVTDSGKETGEAGEKAELIIRVLLENFL